MLYTSDSFFSAAVVTKRDAVWWKNSISSVAYSEEEFINLLLIEPNL